MKLYYELSLMVRTFYGIGAIFLAIAVLGIWVMVCRFRMKKRYLLCACILGVETLFVFRGITDVNSCLKSDRSFSFFANVFGRMPYQEVLFIMILNVIGQITFMVVLWRKKETVLIHGAIKESLDNLQDGICFFDGVGQPLLVNKQMNRICGEVFDMEILNGELFWKQLEKRAEKEFQRGSHKGSVVTVCTKDGRIWEFCRTVLNIRKKEICELVAHDVTEQYELSKELEERNKKLVRMNERLCKYSLEVEHIATENAILQAKMQVHDNVGHSLLAFRSYLSQPENERDKQSVLLLWRDTIAILRKEADTVEESSDWNLLMKAAQAVDVTIMRKGELPQDKKKRKIVISALHECLTNTIKHAGGNELYCSICANDIGVKVELMNNGTLPENNIQETGGLKNLRHMVESEGGNMTIESRPRFILRVEL